MFVEAERVQIRKWLGTPAIFLQAEPRLEQAIQTIQSIADGGTRADNSTELAVRGYLADLTLLETKMKDHWDIFLGNEVGSVKADAVRGVMMLRSEGRRIVGYLGDALAFAPVRDVFVGSGVTQRHDPFHVER